MNWPIVIIITTILFVIGTSAVYVVFDPNSTIGNIVGGVVGISSAAIGLTIGKDGQ